jgi:DOPA 4,5-dioxygenase
MTGTGPISSYHAHIYYTASERATAATVRAQIDACFVVQLGRWHDGPVGPHPRGMYQVAFRPDQLATLVPWLMLNRAGLAVLVHPNTGDPYRDHMIHALWLGAMLPLTAAGLPRHEVPSAIVPNSAGAG